MRALQTADVVREDRKPLSYTPLFCIMIRMARQNPDEPRWKQRAIAIEFWVLTAFVGGAFVVGVIGAISAL